MIYSHDDFLSAYQQLLPTGAVWPKGTDTIMSESLRPLMATWEALASADYALLIDTFPATTTELLTEWQESLGLPDPCAGDNPTLAQQRAQIVSRLTDTGGCSVSYFISFAAALGYTITITQFAPSRFGRTFGNTFGGDAWSYAWQVNMPEFTISDLTFGDQFGSAFAAWGDTVLQCELARIKPAHTALMFNYES
ncbi:YmfQ family protein [Acetobacter oeni]|uniref:Tail protein n=1 Tax=Acetobacter oeni TaxID=304077 RepID=A0A511XP07_9PROT|nr:putative phage tail protein [Acetobacter oeni]MBB3884499.1 uncharacterized protein YmfQ (DUF2313 family) [Acetobacter oeni]NHO20431.1 DUF2313 domain-containing protein [Acetobacter oeni]GBR00563.1 bacteriophage tail protein [Acetobacter oeni LMG 21952]GEN64690.1 tail protein [Acetobacter oeni]